jgi:hypothetical protein
MVSITNEYVDVELEQQTQHIDLQRPSSSKSGGGVEESAAVDAAAAASAAAAAPPAAPHAAIRRRNQKQPLAPPTPCKKPPVPHLPHKPSPAMQLGLAFDEVMRMLKDDWRGMRSLNLGEK